MLRRFGIHVVEYGPSLADDDHYFLARAFASQAEREEQLTAFYGSDEWRRNYEDAVARLIASYHKVVIPLAAARRRGARRGRSPGRDGRRRGAPSPQ
jgi:hypothetical protein